MNDISQQQEAREFAAEATSLWRITFAPLIWAVHFVICYAATAVTCARGGDIDGLRIGIAVGTLCALLAILWLARMAWRQWDVLRDRDWENDTGTGEDRHQFLGHAAFLLAIISFIGVAYVGLPVLLIGSCQ